MQIRLVARMLHQARVERGMRILEIGAGAGYNAALLAELVGPTGQVVTVDIDPVVVESARAALDTTGYTDRVTVVQADGAEPLGLGLFDRSWSRSGCGTSPRPGSNS
ncbi:methyltransferase domain-containing protein [Promicromonospora iranensis]|nr:methyltransferase domain-containing protein [Promicromonospora iranensis]